MLLSGYCANGIKLLEGEIWLLGGGGRNSSIVSDVKLEG
jgi:hypothetical protein